MIRAEAALYGIERPSVITGWVAHVFHTIIFGVLFAGVVSGYVDQYINTLLKLTHRSQSLTDAFMPLIDRFGMATVVTSAMGLLFGIVLWLLFAVLLIPLMASGFSAQFPQFDRIAFVGYVFYGIGLGAVYGILITR